MILIAGCGFVGAQAAKELLKLGFPVSGLTHSLDSARAAAEELQIQVVAADISDLRALESATQTLTPPNIVICCVSSGRGGADTYRSVYYQGSLNLLNRFPSANHLFVSSTSVYAQDDGDWVDETSETLPDRETSQILLETEKAVLRAGGCVIRPGGIYGPGRSILLKRMQEGTAIIEGTGARYLNQIHRDDVAGALAWICSRPEWPKGEIFNVVDNQPATQFECYQWLSTRLELPFPNQGEIDQNRKRGVTNKRVSNTKLRKLGWEPKFVNYQKGLESVLASAGK